MNRFPVALLATAIVTASTVAGAATSPTKLLFDSTVCITGSRPDGAQLEGSGVIVSPGDRVLTVAHALRGATEVRVRLYDGRSFPAKVARFAAAGIDLALLELGAGDLPAAEVAEGGRIDIGSPVRTVGCPMGNDLTMTAGRIRGYREFEGVPLLQTNVAVHPGSSGGPLFDDRGRIVGIVKARAGDTEDVNFALPADLIRGFLGSLDTDRTGPDLFDLAVAEQDPVRKAELYREATEALPDLPEPRYNLALTLEKAGRLEEAADQYREVLRRTPAYVPASLNLGTILYGQGRVDEAISIYQALLRHTPDSVRGRNNLAEAYRKSGRTQQAKIEFLRIVKAASSYAPAQYGLALLYEEDLGDPRSARRHYERYLALVPSGPDATDVRNRLSDLDGSRR